MSAMEKMVAQMLGITPERMGEMVTGFQDMLTNLSATLTRIEAKLDALASAQKDGGNGPERDGTG